MVFPVLATFIDHATGCIDEARIKDIRASYSDLVNGLLSHSHDLKHRLLDVVSKDIQEIKQKEVRILDSMEWINLFVPKFHMLDHISNYLSRFEDLCSLDSSAF